MINKVLYRRLVKFFNAMQKLRNPTQESFDKNVGLRYQRHAR